MSLAARQDKATNDRHTKTLRELVKRPENKLCVDCKRNDPRWASWNLGCFLCIRCSGIHRSMGTHISRVKSIDLDMWTPEQMESVQKWGNARANAYWEAHLKAGHLPPDHKIESFIRSKYESRRWAMDGPLPADPSVLDSGVASQLPLPPASPPIAPPSNPRTPVGSTHPPTTRQPQPHQLLSTGVAGRTLQQPRQAASVPAPAAPAAPAPAPAPAQPNPQEDLFSLDFHSASPPPGGASNGSAAPLGGAGGRKDVKQDILSLFSTPSAAPTAAPAQSAFGQFTAAPQANQWAQMGSGVPAQPTQPATTSMMGTTGWGASAGWTGQGQGQVVPPVQANVWATSAQPQQATANQTLFGTDNIWANGVAAGGGASNDPFGAFASPTSGTQKKDDAFGDLWGGFK